VLLVEAAGIENAAASSGLLYFQALRP